jgi:hypothetical protein
MARDIACSVPSEFIVSAAREANGIKHAADMKRNPWANGSHGARPVRSFVDSIAYRIGPDGSRIAIPVKAKARSTSRKATDSKASIPFIIAAPAAQHALRDWKADSKARLIMAIRQGQ